MTIRIDRLSITLPQNLQHRAGSIVHQFGQSLASGAVAGQANVERLTDISARCSMHQHDSDIGRTIADVVRQGLVNTGGTGE